MTTIAIGTPKTTAEFHVRSEVLQAPPMTTDTGLEFTPASISVTYAKTNQRPWRFSRVVVRSERPGGPCIDLFSTDRRHVEAQPQWVRDFIAQNLPDPS